MGTYYRWSKSTTQQVVAEEKVDKIVTAPMGGRSYFVYEGATSVTISGNEVEITQDSSYRSNTVRYSDGARNMGGYIYVKILEDYLEEPFPYKIYKYDSSGGTLKVNRNQDTSGDYYYTAQIRADDDALIGITTALGKGTNIGYVYSTSASAYPNDGVSGSYYYDQRTTVTSPTAPGSLTYPSPITTPSVTVSWGAASSNVPTYGVSSYELSYSTNGGSSWTVAGTTSGTSLSVSLPVGTTSVQFRVRAKDSNGQWGSYTTGSNVNVFLAPTLTAPSLAMQGQDITLKWTAITGATSYTLQRKADTDADWVEVYSGAALTFTETVGTWTGVQYRVQADFDGVTGDWATSASIPVVSDSALVISGQDGDLGTLVNDVPYTISTDTGNQITVRTTVNGFVILEGTVPSGTAERIPVLDLVHGNGTIVIEASVETDGGTVSAARIWTYNKAAMTFPNAGSPAQLTKEGENIWPKTLAECVRLPGGRTLEEVMGFPCQIYVGRYTGTGTYGSGDPNEVSVPFKPQAVFVTSGSVGTTIPMIRPCTSAKNSSATLTVTWEDDGVSWYSTSAANQLNAAGTTYDIVAFG